MKNLREPLGMVLKVTGEVPSCASRRDVIRYDIVIFDDIAYKMRYCHCQMFDTIELEYNGILRESAYYSVECHSVLLLSLLLDLT